MAAFAARRFNPAVKAFADRVQKAGKPARVILPACLRKLVAILVTLVRNNTTWQLAKLSENA